jgi:coenzyme F420-reducing hydrogenase alpha subunit
MKKIGNEIVTLIGGREIHPINVRVGGFYRVPTKRELLPLAERLKWGRDAALATVQWVATLPFPDFEYDYEFVALRHPDEYPFNEGRLVSNKGLDIPVSAYEDHFAENHVAHSNALQSARVGHGAYFAGPLARYTLNYDRLSPLAQEAARSIGMPPECRNPFKGIIVRSLETLYAYDEALRLIEQYEPPDVPAVPITPRAGVGQAVTEAPRGILYHRYNVAADGTILEAKIIPPTSQNQKQIEIDLGQFVARHLDLPLAELTWKCEQAVRNYDPCISCATHFLTLHLERE